MNRRIAVIVSIVGLNLMACCCGGLPQQAKPNKLAVANPPQVAPEKKAGPDDPLPLKNPLAIAKPPEPSKPKDTATLLSKFSPDQFIARFGKPDSDTASETDRVLVYKNERTQIVYVPVDGEGPVKAWKLDSYKADTTGATLTEKQILSTLRNRDNDEDAKAKRIAQQIERDEIARKAEFAERGPTRANYATITNGMSIREVEAILGPGKENASARGVLIATWQSGGFNPTIISITFQNGIVQSKAIIGK